MFAITLKALVAMPGQADEQVEIALHAAGRGNPWVNLRDGVALPADYAGAARLTQALKGDQARPRALTAGDLDEDGVPDLVAGYTQCPVENQTPSHIAPESITLSGAFSLPMLSV